MQDEITHLSPEEENNFREWARKNNINDVDHPDSHYDYRGYWKETNGAPHRIGDHFPDTYKQHGHPTFSVESKYSSGPNDGGRWNGDKFVPQQSSVKQYPFRQPVNYEDAPDDQAWTPPEYAKPVDAKSSGEAWKPPDYAKPIAKKEAPKESVFSRAKRAAGYLAEDLKKPKKAIDEFVTSTLAEKSAHPYIKRLLTSQDPATESFLPTTKEAGIKEPTTYWGGFRKGLYDEWVRPLASATGAAGLLGTEEARAAEKLPIRQSREIPYRMGDSVQERPLNVKVSQEDIRPPSETQIAAEKPIVRPNSDGTFTLKNPTKETIDFADTKGYRPTGEFNPDGSVQLVKKEVPIKQTVNPNFVNPFEKPKVAEENLTVGRAPDRAIKVIQQANRDGKISDEEALNQIQKVIKDEKGISVAPFQEIPTELPIKAPGTEFQAPPPRAKAPSDIPIKRDILRDYTGEKFDEDTYNKARQALQMGLDKPEEWKAPDYAKPAEEVKAPEEAPKIETPSGVQTTQTSGLADKTISKLQEFENAAIERIRQRGTFSGGRLAAGLPLDDLADFAIIGSAKIARGLIKFTDWSADMIKDFGETIKPYLKDIFKAAQNKHEEYVGGASLKLLNTMLEAKGSSVEQQIINKAERAKRFAASASIREGGLSGAAKSLAAMKGEFEKATPPEGHSLEPEEKDFLFTAIKNSKLIEPEKVRARAALFKLINGEEVPQPNELRVLDRVFGKYFAKVSGPGGSTGYDISDEIPKSFEAAGEKLRKPDDFLTKLANFSSKTTRAVLGFHIPGTALSFHGFNEAIRNTMFGPNFNPFKAAGRFADASYYLIRPEKAQEFLDANLEELGKAIEEGGLRAHTGDIGYNSLFKGSNFITKGINVLTSPKPLFGRVIPALKLKAYQGLLSQYEKSGMPHFKAAQIAGEATNNIFGGLNLTELERSPNTQKLFRVAALAPDWLESNVRLGKGMFDAIKNPRSPQSKVYLSGMLNFLGSYIALNVINAVNNNGKFSFQNDVGHEFDVAIGKDSMGRVRYFSPYGTAMDMFRIPLEIGHAAVEGNLGKAFSDMRSRASEPLQFMTDLATNTDYAGRSLYDKTKFGKPIPLLEQGENIVGDASGHFLPIGAEAGVNFARGKISPEQFAAQVLQAPMKYKYPEKKKLSLGKMRLK